MLALSSPSIPLLFPKREALGEGGLITGTNPAAFTTTDPLRLWIIQVGVIIIITQLLSFGLRRLRQPKAIAEVLGGILLGPTALGRIPGFTEHIFPAVSLPYLSLVGNIGLCLFLFLVGLTIDTSIIQRNVRMSVIVSLAGIALPFGLGSAISFPLYYLFIDPSVHFAYFMLFTSVAYSITAFPILCPILIELRLLNTHIGIIALSASIGNTIIGWTLLALGVALVNTTSSLTALWILLVCISFAIFLLVPVKFALRWLAHKTGSIENGPSMFFMTVAIILVWASGFFTDCIGVNAIFGAFLVGLIVPREGGLAITLTEKIRDIVSIVFLPLYFTFSGLNTNLGLLDNGITWAFTIAIITLSFSGKFGSCMIASRLAGYGWRESSMIGGLMSCKGLVELIVLNVGLQAGVLSQRVFSMFVLEALTLTLITTPLVTTIYPPERRNRVDELPPPLEDDEHGQINGEFILTEERPLRLRFTVVLNELGHIPSAMALTHLILPPRRAPSDYMSTTTTSEFSDKSRMPHMSMEALQLIELSDQTSAMESSASDNLTHVDSILGIFRVFAELNELSVTTSLLVIPYDDFARSVAEHAYRHASHLVVLPWSPFATATRPTTDAPDAHATTPKSPRSGYNPFDVLFGNSSEPRTEKPSSVIRSQFVRGVFTQSKTDVALFVDTGDRSEHSLGRSVHVFLPFFGGPDDRLALDFVVQLCLNPRTTATVVRIVKQEGAVDENRLALGEELLTRPPAAHLPVRLGTSGTTLLAEESSMVFPLGSQDTIYGQPTTQMRLQSETADDIAWARYVSPTSPSYPKTDIASACSLRQALARIHFSDAHTSTPLRTAIGRARALHETSPPLLIVAGRSRRLVRDSHHAEMKSLPETYGLGVGPAVLERMRKTIGDVGAAMTFVMGGSASAVVVLQAAHIASD